MKVDEAIEILQEALKEKPYHYTRLVEVGWVREEDGTVLGDQWYDHEAIAFAIKVLRSLT